MVELIHPKDMENLGFSSKIEAYYLEENPKALLIRLPGGLTFWVPKRFIDSKFSKVNNIKQEFIIDTWILRKIGFRI